MSNIEVYKKNQDSIVKLLERASSAIEQALPKHLTADRMLRIATTALRTKDTLAMCTPGSFIGAVLQASQLGLEVETILGQAYLVPFKNTQLSRDRGYEVKDAQLIIGYKGFVLLGHNSGHPIMGRAVYQGDEFDYAYGTEPFVKHKPLGLSRDITHVYAHTTVSGVPVPVVLTTADINYYRGFSRGAQRSDNPWNTNYDSMAIKTAVRRLVPWIPMSAELQRASALDGARENHRAQSGIWSEEVQDALHSAHVEVEPEEVPQLNGGNPFDGGES